MVRGGRRSRQISINSAGRGLRELHAHVDVVRFELEQLWVWFGHGCEPAIQIERDGRFRGRRRHVEVECAALTGMVPDTSEQLARHTLPPERPVDVEGR